jgi:hypothetical protein
MARKKMFTDSQKMGICELYISGKSLKETGLPFGISDGAVRLILKKFGVKARSVADGNSLKWTNQAFKTNQIQKRTGKPSGAKGKKWTIDRVVKKPGLRGNLHPNWQGGKTKLSFVIRNTSEYRVWRILVFKRDKYTCVLCGDKNRVGHKIIIDADHIYPYSKIIEDFGIKTVEDAISCPALWSIDNGRCLCRDCHKKTETWGPNIKKPVFARTKKQETIGLITI